MCVMGWIQTELTMVLYLGKISITLLSLCRITGVEYDNMMKDLNESAEACLVYSIESVSKLQSTLTIMGLVICRAVFVQLSHCEFDAREGISVFITVIKSDVSTFPLSYLPGLCVWCGCSVDCFIFLPGKLWTVSTVIMQSMACIYDRYILELVDTLRHSVIVIMQSCLKALLCV